eukprot:scaffold7395_cov27-Phaeocystis_antarctica.AAC.1
MPWHGTRLLVHHVLVREDSAARVEPEHFLHEELVRLQQGASRGISGQKAAGALGWGGAHGS